MGYFGVIATYQSLILTSWDIQVRILTPQSSGYFEDPKTPLQQKQGEKKKHILLEGPWGFLGSYEFGEC